MCHRGLRSCLLPSTHTFPDDQFTKYLYYDSDDHTSDSYTTSSHFRMEQCSAFLKTVVYYLRKCDCTSALAKLARRSLPKAALWFPRLMKRARVAMDAYVHRWEGTCTFSPIVQVLTFLNTTHFRITRWSLGESPLIDCQ